MMKPGDIGSRVHLGAASLLHDGLPGNWREAWLAGLPHGLLATLFLILTLVSPLQLGDETSSLAETFALVVALALFLSLVVVLIIARRQGWPRWSGSYYLYAFLAAATPVLLLLQILDTEKAYRVMDMLLYPVLILILVFWVLVVVLREAGKGLLMLVPVSILSWWLVLEFIPGTIRNPLQAGMFVVAALVAVWSVRSGSWRQGMWVLVAASLVVGLPIAYFRTYQHQIPAPYAAEPSLMGMWSLYAKTALWSVLLVIGPMLVWVLRELGLRDANGGRQGYRLVFWGLVSNLVINLTVDRSYSMRWFARYPLVEILSGVLILGSALVFLVGVILTLRLAESEGSLSLGQALALGMITSGLPVMLMLPIFDTLAQRSTILPFGLIYGNQLAELGVYGLGLAWLLVAGWLITRLGGVEKEGGLGEVESFLGKSPE